MIKSRIFSSVLCAGFLLVENTASALDIENTLGKNTLETVCLSCHGKSAPPMFAVKKRYQKKFSTRDEFIKRMVSWVPSPSVDKALLKHAVKMHGLMPPQQLDTAQLKNVAAYIYDTDLKRGRGHKGKQCDHGSDKHDDKKGDMLGGKKGMGHAGDKHKGHKSCGGGEKKSSCGDH